MSLPIDRMGGLSPLPPPLTSPGAASTPARGARPGGTAGPSFAEQLSASSGGVQFSKHALERVQRRGIATDPGSLQRLGHGVDLAAGKGSRAAVVMVDDSAFVVAVPSRTVITAIDRAHMRDHVFTNVDSAVVA